MRAEHGLASGIGETLGNNARHDQAGMPAIGFELEPHHFGEVLHPGPEAAKALELADDGVAAPQRSDRRKAAGGIFGVASASKAMSPWSMAQEYLL